MKLDPQLTGNAGLCYCCYHLSLLGWNDMPTARNPRGVDIIAYGRDASRFVPSNRRFRFRLGRCVGVYL